MVTYENLENSVVARLSSVISSTDSEVLSLAESNDRDSNFAKARITVVYVDSEYSDEIIRGYPNNFATDVAVQDEYYKLRVIVSSRFLRTNTESKSIYWLLEKVKQALLGYDVQHFGRLFLFSTKFNDHEDTGIFSYEIVFIGKRVILQKETDDAGAEGENITEIDFENVIT